MQVSFNNIYKATNIYPPNKNITMPDKNLSYDNYNYNPTFQGVQVTKPIISTKINNEKARMLKKMNEILKTNVPILDKEQLLEIIERRATSILRLKNRKKISYELEIEAIENSPYMSPQQKINRLKDMEREVKAINKIDPFAIPDYLIPKETKESYDYKLIEKFKLALTDNNFDLRAIYQEHYSKLNEIKTLKELREKYPSFDTIPSFDEIIADKIIKTLTRDTYKEFDKAVMSDNETQISKFIYNHLLEKTVIALEELGIKDSAYISNFLKILSERFAKTCALTINENRLSTIQTISKLYIPEFSQTDKIMSQINYDNFVLHVLKEHYLQGKKLNEITYTEGTYTIKVADLKGSEYKFEKFSENIKRFITDSEKIKQQQREYLKFTPQELKDRLMYYEKTAFGYDEDLFNIFAEFESCKFTEEDKNNLIILLKELDKISDGIKTLKEGKEFLAKSNVRPHGTNKINEAAKEEARAQIRAEQHRNQKLNALRDNFNTTVNELYEIGLIAEADLCMKYYPLNSNSTELEKSEKVINFIKNCIIKYDKKTAQAKIARWEIYNEYFENATNTAEFKDAKKFAQNIDENLVEDTIGQYLLNRNIIDSYPESKKLFSEPKLLDDIIAQTGRNKDFATRLLCKYENYKTLSNEQKSSIFGILDFFKEETSADKIILRHIIENDYMNCNTSIIVERDKNPQRRTIAAKAKREIHEKYNYPGSIEFFKKFENALPLDARNENSSGVKKTDKYDAKMDIKYELKIMGRDDRLFACNKDFYFDTYSELGFH